MSAPQEICDIHDLRIDEHGCWACGHGGPITSDVAVTWLRWAVRGWWPTNE